MERISQRWILSVSNRRAALLLLVTASLLLIPWAASAQTVQHRVDVLSGQLKRMQDIGSRMPKPAKDKLSSSAQHLLLMAARFDTDLQSALAQSTASLHGTLSGRPFAPQSGTLPRGQVNDPSTDLAFSRLAGFVQSETSTAWCGDNVVVAYNDSGSFLETFPIPGIGLSFNGYSQSSDRGRSFTDQGYLNPGPNINNFLGGDPVVACTDESTFYYSSIFSSSLSDTGVSVSKSTDGGMTFGDPVEVVSKDGFFHFIDKPWMATDPSNPNKLYVTYTDFDFTGTICSGLRLGIELVRSTDGGATWSAPTVIDNGCYPNTDQGSNVAVDGAGNVYVAWEQFPAAIPTNEIDIVKSTNGGATFGPKVAIAIVTPVGHTSAGLLQGGFRNNEFPMLAIDRSRANGPIYATWNDGRFVQIPDAFPPGVSGVTYNFGDALVSRSNDGGATWSAAVKVNNNKNAASSPGTDHYLPGIAVDHNGAVGVCWYDRRRDPENFLIDRECAVSRNGGQTWRNHRITSESFSPSIAADLLVNPVYMGDYDTTAADTLGHAAGFLGAFGDNTRGNPDVSISRRFGGGDDDNNDDE
jgi:hypothetical protein